MPSLASSLGWKFMMPSGIQRRAPFTPLPTPGISTATSSTRATTKIQGAHFSQSLSGICSTSTATTKAKKMEMMCRVRKWVEA